MGPFVVAALGAGAAVGLGALIYGFYKEAASHDALASIAKDATREMPRGERAFTPIIAQALLSSLPSRFYGWPDEKVRDVVQLKNNAAQTILSDAVSAAGWGKSLSKTRSILAVFTPGTKNS